MVGQMEIYLVDGLVTLSVEKMVHWKAVAKVGQMESYSVEQKVGKLEK
jgi:hypothetical protein